MSTPIVRRRKKPVEVDTIQWTGTNLDEVIDFTGGDFLLPDRSERIFCPEFTAKVYDSIHDTWVRMKTGQHIVRGIQGELYPIAEDVLAETYEPVEKAPAGAATATPDFFEAGRTYTNSESPQYGWRFRCDAVTAHPEDGERTAIGWRFFNGQWTERSYGEDDWKDHRFVDATEAAE